MSIVRESERTLERWHQKAHRKPLVIRGARQVGKSTLVRQFAAKRSLALHEVNLEQRRTLEGAFATLDVTVIVRELEGLLGARIGDGDLLFLDEIQATPSALPALRYLYEQRPNLAVVAAGSLLELVLADHNFSMPVGRIEYLYLGPLTFSEFLRGTGRDYLFDVLSEWEPGTAIADSAHQALCQLQREFMVVGGMPEAVATWASESAFDAVADVQRSIVSTYKDDFGKYGGNTESLRRLQQVFEYVPTALGQKIKYSNIDRDTRARELRSAIDRLAAARVISLVHHSACSGVPLTVQIDPHVYKALFLDVGLAAHALGVRWNDIARLDERQLVNEGGLAEQFIGQHLLYRARGIEPPSLVYWLREARTSNAEVDYVIAHARQVIPVEVKAGSSGTLKSLHRFFARDVNQTALMPTALRFDLNLPSLTELDHALTDGTPVRYQLLSLPLYMVDQTERLLGLAET